jgi:uncharacterized LabA/DUF88 family protein
MTNRKPKPNNFAFIDSQNLNLSIQQLGWKLDFYRFRRYLKDKYNVTRAIIFVGFMEENKDLYEHLSKVGYDMIYKPTLSYKDGTTKGNVDTDLVLHAMIEWNNYDQAVIVSGDGDFYGLVEYMINHEKLAKLVIPNQHHYSALLKRFDSGYLAFVSDLKSKMAYHSRKPKIDGETPAPKDPVVDAVQAKSDAVIRPERGSQQRKEPQTDQPVEGAFRNHDSTPLPPLPPPHEY